ncbi:hypothetical protein AGDE_05043 [Angomonas deanei]|uniref:LicD family, putative n=1 Tax=Angomonas deanei TaxID=59799 RepID=S9UHN7_9TRYP|nr:hypothetical protein AGDE_09494 [Angomonas deanei]EPY38886.1 hypothetical protein AGDE_05043 [Angomonas deanei]CAD2214847.1 LicD family, putative [Angomonas deanei]|eukprot:EPY30337.1 hypothetical protein AGDE_09494 [Angomonas deanei]
MSSQNENTAEAAPSDSSKTNETEPSPYLLFFVRAGVVALLSLVTYITVTFCTQVYYDRESAFHDALQCTEDYFERAGVKHWIQNGTLLGSTRLGRLVLWDADLDFGILDDDAHDLPTVLDSLDAECYNGRTSVSNGQYNDKLRIWKKCTKRICADFHETVTQKQADGSVLVVSGNGKSLYQELFPLKECAVARVKAKCPNNSPFYLAQAYGSDWFTTPLAKLF